MQDSAQTVAQTISTATRGHYDSSGNRTEGWDLAGATVSQLPDGRTLITTADGKKYVHRELTLADRAAGITGVFNAPDASIEGIQLRIDQDEADRAAAMAAGKGSSGSSSSGGSSSKKPTISGTQSGVLVGSGVSNVKPTLSAPASDKPAQGQTVNITVNGDVSTPSSFAQTVSNIASALSKPLISWFT